MCEGYFSTYSFKIVKDKVRRSGRSRI